MNHYQDFFVLPDAEITTQALMATLFSRLHLALVKAGPGRIGVSFPGFEKTPGAQLRLHGTLSDLESLESFRWHAAIKDYITHNAILSVPNNCQYRCVRRVQYKSSAERLRRRSVKKGWLTEDEAKQQITLFSEKRSELPFLPLKSGSNGQAWFLFIEHGPLSNIPHEGLFSSYGLSATATIPWF